MAKKDYKKLEDTNIVTLIDDCIGRSVGYSDSELSTERSKVIDYYNGTLPKPIHDGNSKYVSLDVYDAVESLRAALLETFSSGNKTVKFAAQNQEDVLMAQVCTEYTDYVCHRQNDLYNIFSSVIFDGLVARVGVAKVFWQESKDYDYEDFEELTEDELDMLLAQDGIDLVDDDEDDLGLHTGTISIEVDTSQVVIENIAPEEFLIEAQAKNLDDVNFCAHRTKKTISELRLMGYDESDIDKIGEHNDVDLETDPEVLSRFENIGNGRGFDSGGYQDQVRTVMVYEAYIMLDVEATGEAELYRVVKAGNVLLEKSKATRRPFVTFCPLPVPHTFYGNNYSSKVIATQNARTVLTRSILDHAMITNNPRYTVLKGALTNPRELIDNRVGGLVNVTRPDAISPMMQAPLNPFIFQTIAMLDEDKEDTTGVSKISQGLNKDALSQQNSAAMVEQLATMSQQRQKIIARNFASQFVKPLFQEVYLLCVENETQDKIVELSGKYVKVNPRAWKEKRDVTIEMHLGYGEQQKEAEKYLNLHAMLSADPNLSVMYQQANQYELAKKIMTMTGIKDVDTYLTNPEELPEPQPDPAEEMQKQMLQQQMELQERQTTIGEMKLQMEMQMAEMKNEIERMKLENQLAIASDQLDHKEDQLDHKKEMNIAELVLAQQAEEITAIASPNG
jgi:hypothetical protein